MERGSCRGVDEFTHDIVSGNIKDKPKGPDKPSGDTYDSFGDIEKPIFPFGKAVTTDRGIIKWRNDICGRSYCITYGVGLVYLVVD